MPRATGGGGGRRGPDLPPKEHSRKWRKVLGNDKKGFLVAEVVVVPSHLPEGKTNQPARNAGEPFTIPFQREKKSISPRCYTEIDHLEKKGTGRAYKGGTGACAHGPHVKRGNPPKEKEGGEGGLKSGASASK